MKLFKELTKAEQKKAIDLALNEFIKMVYDGKYEIKDDTIICMSEKDMKEILLPEARKFAEMAYYPESSDVIIKLW
jgi:hypothetical protein